MNVLAMLAWWGYSPAMSELWQLDATDLATKIAAREVSSTEVLEALLARVAAVNPKLNAIVRIMEEDARITAKTADAMVARGDKLGSFHGVPITVKENIDMAGLPTTQGVVMLAEAVVPGDAPIVERMRACGAIPFARTNLPDLGLRVHTDSGLHGLTRNPWNYDRTVAGSSGGEASSLASGMSPFGLGNDLGGSLRNPANAAGICSIKPSFGRVPAANYLPPQSMGPGFAQMAVQGVMARTVRDVRRGLLAVMGAHPRDPLSISAPLVGPEVPKRVMLCAEPAGSPTNPEIAAVVRQAGEVLRDHGYEVVEGHPPASEEIARIWSTLVAIDTEDMRAFLESAVSADGKRFSIGAEGSAPSTRAEVVAAFTRRHEIARMWSELMAQTPIIVLPTWTQVPFPHGWDIQHGRGTIDQMRPVLPANLLGLPSACVPAGMADGSPVAVQVMADRFREDVALDVAAIIEASGIGPKTPIDPAW